MIPEYEQRIHREVEEGKQWASNRTPLEAIINNMTSISGNDLGVGDTTGWRSPTMEPLASWYLARDTLLEMQEMKNNQSSIEAARRAYDQKYRV